MVLFQLQVNRGRVNLYMDKNDFIEKTLVILKPDAIQRSLIGEIIKRFEGLGLKFSGIKLFLPTADLVEKHYTVDPNWKKDTGEKAKKAQEKKGITVSKTPEEIGERVLSFLKKFMTSGPVVIMVIEGAHAVPLVRKIVGGTEPLSSDVGTIRGDYVFDSYEMADTQERAIRNLIHASSDLDSAKKEIDIWFKKDELLKYTTAQERFIYDVEPKNIFG